MPKKTSLSESQQIATELELIENEIQLLEEDLGDLGLAQEESDFDLEDSSAELVELNSVISGSEFDSGDSPSASNTQITVLDIADGLEPEEMQQEGFFGDLWNKAKGLVTGRVKRAAKAIIMKILKLVRKYRKLSSCIPKVTAAVAAYKTGRYGTALKLAYAAYRCIRSRL